MVRTRSSARLSTKEVPETESSQEESTYQSLERLEKLEKRLRSKKPKLYGATAASPGKPGLNPVKLLGSSASSAEPSTSEYLRIPILQQSFQGLPSNNAPQNFNSQVISPYQQQFNMSLAQQADMDSQYQMMQIWRPRKSPMSVYPVHPDVTFRKLPFYEIIRDLITPCTIDNRDSRMHSFQFHLTPQEVKMISNERDVVSIQLRFCLLETSCEQDDVFPPNLVVKVNSKFCPLPMPLPTNKVIVEPKRPPGPVNITSLSKVCPMFSNSVSLTWKSEFGRQYAFCVGLVRKLTSSQLLTRLKNKGTKHPDFTRSLIKEKLREDLDCEIATTSLRVSLVCPLGKMRMVCPCRPATCSHLQCFDASLFLQMNEHKSTWICPVCDKHARYDNLVVDGYFQDVLNSPSLEKDCTEIQLHKDGSWSVHLKEILRDHIISDVTNNSNIEIINDDMADVIPLSDGSESSTGLPSLKRPISEVGNSGRSTNIAFVDLISDDSDDDDDDIPLKKMTPNPPDIIEPLSIEVPSFNNADSTTCQEINELCDPVVVEPDKDSDPDGVIVSGIFTSSRTRSSSIITLDSPSPPAAPASPVAEVMMPRQAIVAPFHPEPDPLPIEDNFNEKETEPIEEDK